MSATRRLFDPKYLELFLPCNGHVEDVSGHGNNGTWTGTAKYLPTPFGHDSIDVDGTNDYVSVATTAALRNAAEDSTTLCAWAKSDIAALSYTAIGFVVDFGFAHDQGLGLMFVGNHPIGTNGQIVVYYDNGVDSGTVGNADQWYHIAISRLDSGSGDLSVYIDGELTAAATVPSINLSASYNFVIGAQAKDATRKFNGQIRNVRLYNTTLSGDEIKALYNHEMRGAI